MEHRKLHPDQPFYILHPSYVWQLWDVIQGNTEEDIQPNPPSSGFIGECTLTHVLHACSGCTCDARLSLQLLLCCYLCRLLPAPIADIYAHKHTHACLLMVSLNAQWHHQQVAGLCKIPTHSKPIYLNRQEWRYALYLPVLLHCAFLYMMLGKREIGSVVLFLKSCTHPELARENFPEISLSSLHWIVVQASWKIFKALFWMLYFFRPANSCFVLHLSSFLKYLKETPHTMLRYGYFSAKSSLRITLVGNILYYACQTGIFQIRLKRFC